jgi:3-methyladenine DNA glycosylase/8-oxoguanine DNA glycosylase
VQQVQRVWRPAVPVDLLLTLAPLGHGAQDPTQRVLRGVVWRTTLTPDGPASARLVQQGAEITCDAWGPGAAWFVDGLPELLGAQADLSGFRPAHPLLERVHRAHPGVRIPRTRRVVEALVPAVLEQKVTGKQAREAYVHLLRRYGDPPPGPVPAGLVVPPPAATWGRVPSWEWHHAGVDPRRMRTLLAVAPLASRLEEAVGMAPAAAQARLRAVPGVGEWTAAEVALRALGDTDAVSVGDFHLAQHVGWALTGSPLDDAAMVELLEPWRPYRALVVRLVELSGLAKPRFGPRLAVQDHRRH